jgi:hypothetical protein
VPGLVEALVRFDRVTWLLVGSLWLVTAALLLVQRGPSRAGMARTAALVIVASSTALLGLFAVRALSVPRLVWKAQNKSELVEASGDSWRRLRGPAVQVSVAGVPDLCVPTVDARGDWVLSGLLSGAPLPGVPPAPKAPPEPGAVRICGAEDEPCRAWPSSWPDATRAPAFGELSWTKGLGSAIAYDVESGLFLQSAGGGAVNQVLDLAGRVTNDPPRDGPAALFVLRRLHAGRFDAVRVLALAAPATTALPGNTDGPASAAPPRAPVAAASADMAPAGSREAPVAEYRLERASASLTAAPRLALWVARPLLTAIALSGPLMVLAFALAPVLVGAWLRRRGAVRRELATPLALGPVERMPQHGPVCIAAAMEAADVAGVPVARGAKLRAAVLLASGAAVSSRTWLEVPAGPGDDTPDAATADAPPPRTLGLLVPADPDPFRRVARAWVFPWLHVLAVLCAGAGVALPGAVALVALLGNR